jgi:hypothetical protein
LLGRYAASFLRAAEPIQLAVLISELPRRVRVVLTAEVSTLRNWEQGRREPHGPAKALLRAIKNDPQKRGNPARAARGGKGMCVPGLPGSRSHGRFEQGGPQRSSNFGAGCRLDLPGQACGRQARPHYMTHRANLTPATMRAESPIRTRYTLGMEMTSRSGRLRQWYSFDTHHLWKNTGPLQEQSIVRHKICA